MFFVNGKNTIIRIWDKISSARSSFIFVLFLLLLLFFGYLSNEWNFLSSPNITTLFKIAPELVIVALGMTVVLISGEFDLSVNGTFVLSGMLAAGLVNPNWFGITLSPYLALFVSLTAGIIVGLINGLIVTKLKVSSLIGTFGTWFFLKGLALATTHGQSVYFHPEKVSPLFVKIFNSTPFTVGGFGVPVQLVWAIIIAIVLYILLEHTSFGNEVLSTGSNRQATKMMGIDPDWTKIKCFMIVGFLAAFSGILAATRLSGLYGGGTSTLNLEAIAAAVIGGTSIYGGIGTIPGAFLGALIIRFLGNGLISIGLSMYYFQMALGLVLVVVAAINIYLRRKRRE